MISNIVLSGILRNVKLSVVKNITQCDCEVCVKEAHGEFAIRTRFKFHQAREMYTDGDTVLLSGYLVPFLENGKEVLAIRASQVAKCTTTKQVNVVTLVGTSAWRTRVQEANGGFFPNALWIWNFTKHFKIQIWHRDFLEKNVTLAFHGVLAWNRAGNFEVYEQKSEREACYL